MGLGRGRGFGFGRGRGRGGGEGKGYSCVKFAFFAFNVIFWVSLIQFQFSIYYIQSEIHCSDKIVITKKTVNE